MFLVDSHCHLDLLDLTPYDGDLARALLAAKNQGVGHVLCVSVTLQDFPEVLRIAKRYPHVSASCGLHPNEANSHEPTAEELMKLADDEKVVAIGETGLDHYRSSGDTAWQTERFRQHIRAAKGVKKPLIVHSRQARAETLQVLREEDASDIGGVMHCFTEDWEMAKAAMDLNFYISFSGIVTFSNAKELQEVARLVPLDRILVETDSPYLAPVPFRGKSNEPAFVRPVAEFIANLRGINSVELADKTTENFFKLFRKAIR
jgi:TatD DNase family protein